MTNINCSIYQKKHGFIFLNKDYVVELKAGKREGLRHIQKVLRKIIE